MSNIEVRDGKVMIDGKPEILISGAQTPQSFAIDESE